MRAEVPVNEWRVGPELREEQPIYDLFDRERDVTTEDWASFRTVCEEDWQAIDSKQLEHPAHWQHPCVGWLTMLDPESAHHQPLDERRRRKILKQAGHRSTYSSGDDFQAASAATQAVAQLALIDRPWLLRSLTAPVREVLNDKLANDWRSGVMGRLGRAEILLVAHLIGIESAIPATATEQRTMWALALRQARSPDRLYLPTEGVNRIEACRLLSLVANRLSVLPIPLTLTADEQSAFRQCWTEEPRPRLRLEAAWNLTLLTAGGLELDAAGWWQFRRPALQRSPTDPTLPPRRRVP